MMNASNRFFVLEKTASTLIAFIAVLLLSPAHMLDAVIVFGHGHFVLTYFYQYKAGKIKPIYLLPYLLFLVSAFYIGYEYQQYFIPFVGAFFLFHHFFDEFKLRAQSAAIEYTLLIFLLIGLLAGWTYEFLARVDIISEFLIAVAGVSIVVLAFRFFNKTLKIPLKCPYFLYLLLLSAIFLTLELTGHRPDNREAFGFIILIHYLTWYFHLGARFKKQDNAVFNTYLKRVFIANFIFMVGYYVVVIAMQKQGFLYHQFYHPVAFFVWTLMHMVTTFRLDDYKNGFRLSSPRP